MRSRERQVRAWPLLDDLHAWFIANLGGASAKSDLFKAIGYSFVRWRVLTRYRDDGRIRTDSCAAERPSARCVG